MAYTIHIDGDKKQVSGSAITATSTRVNGGTAKALGTSVPAGPITAQIELGNTNTLYGSQVKQSKDVFGVFHATPVAITSVADSSGKARYTLNGHSLVVGDVINVTGSTTGNVDGPQKVTAKDVNTFTTDKAYVASAAAGSYSLVAGDFATLTVGNYIMRGGVSGTIAGSQGTTAQFGADYGIRRSIHKVEHLWTRRVATAIRNGYWHIYEGVFTTAPTTADDASTFGSDNAATPSYAVPGELVYRVSGQQDATNGVIQADYPAKTN